MDSDVERLTRELSHPRPGRRRKAVTRLAMSPDADVDALLLRAAGDDHSGVRWAAVYGLFERDPSRSVEPIVDALAGGADDAASITCRIVELSLPFDLVRRLLSLERLRAGVTASNAACRAVSLRLLAERSDQDPLPDLARAANDPDRRVRAMAAKILGEMDEPDAARLLARLRRDKAMAVRRAAR